MEDDGRDKEHNVSHMEHHEECQTVVGIPMTDQSPCQVMKTNFLVIPNHSTTDTRPIHHPTQLIPIHSTTETRTQNIDLNTPPTDSAIIPYNPPQPTETQKSTKPQAKAVENTMEENRRNI